MHRGDEMNQTSCCHARECPAKVGNECRNANWTRESLRESAFKGLQDEGKCSHTSFKKNFTASWQRCSGQPKASFSWVTEKQPCMRTSCNPSTSKRVRIDARPTSTGNSLFVAVQQKITFLVIFHQFSGNWWNHASAYKRVNEEYNAYRTGINSGYRKCWPGTSRDRVTEKQEAS
jgi:hypothetical protein